MTEAHTATVSDAAVQAAEAQFTSYFINNYPKDCIIYNPAWHAPKIFRAAKAAMTENITHLALSSAPSSAEVEKLEWVAHNEGFGGGRTYYGKGVLGHWYGVERTKNKVWECYHHIGKGGATYLPTTQSIEEAKAAAQSDYERHILSQIVTKPVDVAVVRGQALEEAYKRAAEAVKKSLEVSEDYAWDEADGIHHLIIGLIDTHPNAIRALSPAEPAQGEQWQDIATAPKDLERLFLASFRNGYLEAVHVGGYSHANNEDEDSCWWSDQDDDMICPTHWMPLPAAPLSSGRTTEGGE